MADPLSVTASCIAVTGLGLKVIHQIDNLIAQWHDADLAIHSLRSQCMSFSASLEELSEWLEKEYHPIRASSKFVTNLARSVEDSRLLLSALAIELQSLEHCTRSRHRKALLLWNHDRIKERQDQLQYQMTALTLLLRRLDPDLP